MSEKSKQPSKAKKILKRILLSILAIVLVLVVVVAVIAGKNVKAMNHCVDAAMAELRNHYTVTPVDPGEYKDLTLYGLMKFDVEQYEIEGIGNLSVMRVNMGVMQMSTFVITPRDRNLPLMSTDYMYMLANRTAYMEFYDVVAEKDEAYTTLLNDLNAEIGKYDQLEDTQATPAWYAPLLTVTAYKNGGFSEDPQLEQMLVDCLNVYLENSKEFPELTGEERAEKLEITVDYTDGLIEKGGISTDVFKSALGDEVTKDFFDKVFFGTAG